MIGTVSVRMHVIQEAVRTLVDLRSNTDNELPLMYNGAFDFFYSVAAMERSGDCSDVTLTELGLKALDYLKRRSTLTACTGHQLLQEGNVR